MKVECALVTGEFGAESAGASKKVDTSKKVDMHWYVTKQQEHTHTI